MKYMADNIDGLYSAEVLADSLFNGVRLTTVLATFPRFILAEVNTHRVFSRNSASSRAIPTDKIIARLKAGHGFVPATFNKRVVGMGIGSELDRDDVKIARHEWSQAMEAAMLRAGNLTAPSLNIDKSRANRLLEPFMWHTAIITSTEWSNFLALRCPPDEVPQQDFPAQWEFQQTAILMRRAMEHSEPAELGEDEWHRPMVDNNDDGDELHDLNPLITDGEMTYGLNMLASRRLARVSFDKHTDTEQIDVSLNKAGDLIGGAHFSPTEHVARGLKELDLYDGDLQRKIMIPATEVMKALVEEGDRGDGFSVIDRSNVWCGNLRGYVQFRKLFTHEEDHAQALAALPD